MQYVHLLGKFLWTIILLARLKQALSKDLLFDSYDCFSKVILTVPFNTLHVVLRTAVKLLCPVQRSCLTYFLFSVNSPCRKLSSTTGRENWPETALPVLFSWAVRISLTLFFIRHSFNPDMSQPTLSAKVLLKDPA